MKKALQFLLLASAIFVSAPTKPVYCQPREADMRSKTVQVCYKLSVSANISTSAVIVDLAPATASTTNWPHVPYGIGQANLTSIDIEVDKAAASTCTVRIGVVTLVDSSTGTVSYFEGINNELNVSNTNNRLTVFYDNQFKNMKANAAGSQTDGTTPALISNINTSGSTVFQTDVVLPAVNTAGVAPGLGDIILSAVNGIGNIVIYVYLNYHSDI